MEKKNFMKKSIMQIEQGLKAGQIKKSFNNNCKNIMQYSHHHQHHHHQLEAADAADHQAVAAGNNKVAPANKGEIIINAGSNNSSNNSRLKKHAPTTLQIDHSAANSDNNVNGCDRGGGGAGGDISRCPIPLLTPLMITPPQFPPAVSSGEFCNKVVSDQTANVCKKGGSATPTSVAPAGGWQYPAIATPRISKPPSTLLSSCS